MGLYRASHVKIRQNTHKIHSSNPCTIWLNFISFHFISFHFIVQEKALENERKKLAEDRLAILENQMRIEKEKQKEKKKMEKKSKQEQMKILGKDKSRPRLSFSLNKNWISEEWLRMSGDGLLSRSDQDRIRSFLLEQLKQFADGLGPEIGLADLEKTGAYKGLADKVRVDFKRVFIKSF